jgi:hypothetical protein
VEWSQIISAVGGAISGWLGSWLTFRLRWRKVDQAAREKEQKAEQVARQSDLDFMRDIYRAGVKDIQDNYAHLRKQVGQLAEAERDCREREKALQDRIIALEASIPDTGHYHASPPRSEDRPAEDPDK